MDEWDKVALAIGLIALVPFWIMACQAAEWLGRYIAKRLER